MLIQASKESAVLLGASWILKFSSREWLAVYCTHSCSDHRHGMAARLFRGCGRASCRCVHWSLRIKWSGGKEHWELGVITTTKKNQLPARRLEEVLLLCQVLFHEKGGVWLLPCSPGLAALPSSGHPVCYLRSWFICLTPRSAPPSLQSFYLNCFPKFGVFLVLPWLNNPISLWRKVSAHWFS